MGKNMSKKLALAESGNKNRAKGLSLLSLRNCSSSPNFTQINDDKCSDQNGSRFRPLGAATTNGKLLNDETGTGDKLKFDPGLELDIDVLNSQFEDAFEENLEKIPKFDLKSSLSSLTIIKGPANDPDQSNKDENEELCVILNPRPIKTNHYQSASDSEEEPQQPFTSSPLSPNNIPNVSTSLTANLKKFHKSQIPQRMNANVKAATANTAITKTKPNRDTNTNPRRTPDFTLKTAPNKLIGGGDNLNLNHNRNRFDLNLANLERKRRMFGGGVMNKQNGQVNHDPDDHIEVGSGSSSNPLTKRLSGGDTFQPTDHNENDSKNKGQALNAPQEEDSNGNLVRIAEQVTVPEKMMSKNQGQTELSSQRIKSSSGSSASDEKKKLKVRGLKKFVESRGGSSHPPQWVRDFPIKSKFHVDNYIYDWEGCPNGPNGHSGNNTKDSSSRPMPSPFPGGIPGKKSGRCETCGIYSVDTCRCCKKCPYDCGCPKPPQALPDISQAFGPGWSQAQKIVCELAAAEPLARQNPNQGHPAKRQTQDEMRAPVGRKPLSYYDDSGPPHLQSHIDVLNPSRRLPQMRQGQYQERGQFFPPPQNPQPFYQPGTMPMPMYPTPMYFQGPMPMQMPMYYQPSPPMTIPNYYQNPNPYGPEPPQNYY